MRYLPGPAACRMLCSRAVSVTSCLQAPVLPVGGTVEMSTRVVCGKCTCGLKAGQPKGTEWKLKGTSCPRFFCPACPPCPGPWKAGSLRAFSQGTLKNTGIYTNEETCLVFTHNLPAQSWTLPGPGFQVKSVFIAHLIAVATGFVLSSESSLSGILPGPDLQGENRRKLRKVQGGMQASAAPGQAPWRD